MTKEAIIKELERLIEWDKCNNILVTFGISGTELMSFYFGVTDSIKIGSDDEIVKVECIERSDIVPTFVRIPVKRVEDIVYYTPQMNKELHDYECESLEVVFNDGYSISFTTEM